MNKKILASLLCVMTVVGGAFARGEDKQPARDKQFESAMLVDMPKPHFMLDGGPMLPMHPGFGPGPMFARDGGGDKIKLSDTQKEQMRNLGEKHKRQLKSLHDEREELREEYLEKFEAILTDEQFRKIEKMRKNLRKEMQKLNEKQTDMMESHRREFESILTDEQRQELHKKHMK